MHSTIPVHLILHDLTILIICGNDIPLMFETKSHAYTQKGKVIVVHILIFTFLCSRCEDKRI
jgi:hypothetical protein